MKKAVVTGGAGFIGSHLTDLLLSEGLEVSVIDNLANSSLKNLKNAFENPKLTFVEADISRQGDWEETVSQADYVFHLAGLAAIVPSIENPREYFSTNVNGTLNVLQATRKSASLVYAASSSCYGIPDNFPTQESQLIDPQYPYALTKLQGEQLVLHWGDVYKLAVKSLRLFNVYGLRSRTDSSYGAMFGIFMAQLYAGKPLTIVGDGKQSRDFVYVTDVARAFYLAALKKTENRIYNVGCGIPVTVKYIADILSKDQINIPKRPGEPDITHADISLIQKELGWSPKITIDEGVMIMKENIINWSDSPVWEPQGIEKATELWFKYLS